MSEEKGASLQEMHVNQGAPGAGRAVIFDVDGVLVDSEPFLAWCLRKAFCDRFGADIPEQDFLRLAGTGSRCITEPARALGLELDLAEFKGFLFERIYLPEAGERLLAFPGGRALVRSLRGVGLRLGVASNASRVKVDANLCAAGLPRNHWDAVVTMDEVAAPKPDPAIYLEAARRLGSAPGDCAVIEDSPTGVAAARSAGMVCLAVASSFGAEALLDAGACRVFASLAELGREEVLARLPSRGSPGEPTP